MHVYPSRLYYRFLPYFSACRISSSRAPSLFTFFQNDHPSNHRFYCTTINSNAKNSTAIDHRPKDLSHEVMTALGSILFPSWPSQCHSSQEIAELKRNLMHQINTLGAQLPNHQPIDFDSIVDWSREPMQRVVHIASIMRPLDFWYLISHKLIIFIIIFNESKSQVDCEFSIYLVSSIYSSISGSIPSFVSGRFQPYRTLLDEEAYPMPRWFIGGKVSTRHSIVSLIFES